jgi:hypothetical protein
MNRSRIRPVLVAVIGLALVWTLALVGSAWFREARVTSEEVAAFLHTTDLSQLTGEARLKALDDLARMINALAVEDRRKARMDGAWNQWFESMSEREKSDFLEATMPGGFKQMLASFEKLPEEKRRQAVESSLREMKKTRDTLDANPSGEDPWKAGPEAQAELSPELREKVVNIGLTTFYNESSAQTKAELAPVLEEMQRLMERGVPFRPNRHGP